MKVTFIRSRSIGITTNIDRWAKALSESGHDVELLVWDREGKKGTESSSGYKIQRFGFRAPLDKPSVLLYYPIWWAYVLFYLLRTDSDVIHAFNLDTLIPAIFVKLITRIKLCYTIYDFYAEILPEKVPGVVRRFIAAIEKFGIGF
jgi:hypothetical protein